MNFNRLYYVWDENLIANCDRLPAVLGRATLVHNLITAYKLLDNLKIVRSSPASYEDMRKFHSDLYLDHLKNFGIIGEDYSTSAQDEEYGIGYDCPPVSNMSELVSALTGGSITAVRCLTLGLADVVINWCGGWHHANRHAAEGFCYINDIVIAIEYLRQKFPKVLYIDLDIHHGNGVQDAYNLSKSVFTLSLHKYEPGFYPGSGCIDDIGTLTGKGYTCNVPLHAFYSNETFEYVFNNVFSLVYTHFAPDAIVVQCGADALAHDPNGGACVTTQGYCACVRTVLSKKKPTVLLGGGGYNFPNAARLWASITALTSGVELDENIPEHDQWPKYGPSYMLSVQPTLSRDANKKSYIEESLAKIRNNITTYLTTEPQKKKVEDQIQNVNSIQRNIPRPTQNSVDYKPANIDVYDFTE